MIILKLLKTVNYISVFFYVWIITLILRIFFCYDLDYRSILIRPEDMSLGIHYDYFVYAFAILSLIIAPISLLFSFVDLIRKKTLAGESLFFLIVNLTFLINVFFIKPRIFIWLAN